MDEFYGTQSSYFNYALNREVLEAPEYENKPFPIQFFCHPHAPQILFILGGKEIGGLLVIILQF
jgi:hypothetical protein